ncbi:hypothetical protein [Kitasatospora sp. NPDC094015]|uniref:hypothetical protein n=1 Tax=Kitasatospora sp. NPDC094015 TaxID=3155205 RepID=UPI0033171CD5
MSRKSLDLVPTVFLVLAPVVAWAAWLGWDQHQDVHADGSVSGPYEAWQVVGLVLTLLVPVCWAASRGRATAAVLGTTAGLTVAAGYDWSDDASGLYLVGAALVAVAALLSTLAVCAVVSAVRGRPRPGA